MRLSLPSTATVNRHLTNLRLSMGGAIFGCATMGLVMSFAGYRGEALEYWRTVGAIAAFIPAWLYLTFGRPKD